MRQNKIIIIALIMALTVASAVPATVAQAETKPALKVGDWVKFNGTYVKTGEGPPTGWNGTWKETDSYTVLITISLLDSSTIGLSRHVEGTWVCSASSSFSVQCNGKQENSGSWSNDRSYTVDRSLLKVTSVSNDNDKNRIGYPTQYMINPSALTEGGITPELWWVPNSDAKGGKMGLADYSVSKQTTDVKGAQLIAWKISYTGDTLGDWNNRDGVYSKGTATITLLYDPLYGILVGASYPWQTTGTSWDGFVGAWTENVEESWKLVDTNLVFTVPVTLSLEPGAGTAITVDGTKYTSDQLQAFSWVIGTTHTLQVDTEIQGAPGVKYVFVQWSDGSKDASRTLTATQHETLSATFKMQYQLTVVSDLDSPQGSGWYDAGSQATFSVTSPQPETGLMGTLGGKTVFQGWSGDSNAASPSATIGMDGPKTVTATWITDATQPYMVLAGLAVVVVVIVVALVILMRRKKVKVST